MTKPPAKDSAARAWAIVAAVAVVKGVFLALLVTAWWDRPWVSHLVQDIRTWRGFFVSTQAGLVPYVHLTKEYPVLGGALYWAMSPFVRPDDLRQTVLVHGLFMLAADVACTALFHRLARAANPGLATPATLLFALNLTSLVMGPVRYEPYVVLFVLLGLAAHHRGRLLRATAWWAVGCGLKWYPAFFVGAQEWRRLLSGDRAHVAKAALVFAATFAALNAPFLVGALAHGHVRFWLDPYLFHARRPLYWDTLLGVGQIWLGPLPWERYAGEWTLGLMAAAVLVRPRLPIEAKGTLVCLAAIVFNRIYSAQFHLWFYPLLLLHALRAEPRRRRILLGAFAALDLLNVLVFPTAFSPALAEMGGFFPYAARDGGGAWTAVFSAAIAVRALVVAALAVALLRSPDSAPAEG